MRLSHYIQYNYVNIWFNLSTCAVSKYWNTSHRRLKVGPQILLKYLNKCLRQHFEEMARSEMDRCKTHRLVAISYLVSCLRQGLLHGTTKTFDKSLKMEEKSTRVVIVCLFLVSAAQETRLYYSKQLYLYFVPL